MKWQLYFKSQLFLSVALQLLAQKCRAVRLLLHRSGLHLIGNRDRDRMCVYIYVPLLHSAGGNSRIQISPPHRLDFFFVFLVDDEIIELFSTHFHFVSFLFFVFKISFLKDICQRPTFIANGASRFDVEQGELGDPWYSNSQLVLSCVEMKCRPLFGGHFRFDSHPFITPTIKTIVVHPPLDCQMISECQWELAETWCCLLPLLYI